MKKVVSAAMFGACLLAISPVVRAQNCNLNDYALRGSYTMSGSGWDNLAALLPSVPGLPNQLVPTAWLGAFTADGAGGVTGWVSINAGGNQMTGTFTGTNYSVKPDCSMQVKIVMKINELPNAAPITSTLLLVPVLKASALWGPPELEVRGTWQGTLPGSPSSGRIESAVAHRISVVGY
jgi:hypothetical protein